MNYLAPVETRDGPGKQLNRVVNECRLSLRRSRMKQEMRIYVYWYEWALQSKKDLFDLGRRPSSDHLFKFLSFLLQNP